MVYNVNSHITSVKEVEDFFDYLVSERKINFHPDDDFSDYVSIADGESIFTEDEVVTFNRLMDEAFEVCRGNQVDIYEIGLRKLRTLFGIPNN